MLPDMAAGLAEQAQAFHGPLDQRHEKAEQARQGLALAEDWRFVPDKLKPWAALQTTSDQVAQLFATVDRSLDADKALTAVRSAVAAGNGADAFAIRDKLLQSYPELRQGTELDAGRSRVGSCRSAVGENRSAISRRRNEAARDADPGDFHQPAMWCNARWSRRSKASRATRGRSESAFHRRARRRRGLLASSEQWSSARPAICRASTACRRSRFHIRARRRMARRTMPRAEPIPLRPIGSYSIRSIRNWPAMATAAANFAGGNRRAMRSTPRRCCIGRRLYVATRGGRLAAIDADSGKWLSAAQFPEPLRAAPVASADGKTLYVAGDHGTLYFVSAHDLTCSAAVDLEYGSGSVRLPPIVLGSYIVLVENSDWDGSDLRVVSLATADAPARAVQKVALPGQAISAPVVVGKQLLLATDKGIVMAFDASGSGAYPLIKSMLKSIAKPPAPGARQNWFLAVAGKQLWLAGNGLAHGDLAASAGATQLAPDQLVGNRFEQSPMVEGDRVIVTYRRSAGSGVSVAAMNPDRQAAVASRRGRAAGRRTDAQRRRFGDSTGHSAGCRGCELSNHCATWESNDGRATVWRRRPKCTERRISGCDASPVAPTWLHCRAAHWPRLSATAKRLVAHLFVSTAKDPAFRPSAWSDAVCSPPVALGKGLLIANPVGQICLVDAATGQSLAEAFQPRLIPGEQLTWRKPAVIARQAGSDRVRWGHASLSAWNRRKAVGTFGRARGGDGRAAGRFGRGREWRVGVRCGRCRQFDGGEHRGFEACQGLVARRPRGLGPATRRRRRACRHRPGAVSDRYEAGHSVASAARLPECPSARHCRPATI